MLGQVQRTGSLADKYWQFEKSQDTPYEGVQRCEGIA
jgi:hypothetical protein